jgi:preprotein translocase subunit SecF
MRIFENLNVDFLAKRKLFYMVSATLFLAGLISVIVRGFQFGIDFKGGTEIGLEFEKPVNISEMRDISATLGLGNVEVKTFGGETGVLLRTEKQELPAELFPRVIAGINKNIDQIYPGLPRTIVDSTTSSVTYEFSGVDTVNTLIEKLAEAGYQTGRGTDQIDNKQIVVRVGISEWIKQNLKEKITHNSFDVQKEDRVGPKVGNELKTSAVLGIVLSLLAILLYLGFRFKFVFAIGAVAALFHDVLITLGLYALLYGVIPGLNLEISLTVVAAFLTLIGYSINDTVVVFDRVRENIKLHKTESLYNNMNNALNRTMSRTILTGGTTLMCLLILLFIGGEVLRSFAFTLFFGILIGTYSSIFVASAFVMEYAERSKKKIQF